MRRALVAAAAVVAVVLLAGCEDADVREQRRYETCLAAGGSYEADHGDLTYECDLPTERIVEVPRAPA